MRKLIISELEKKAILQRYGINEQEVVKPITSINTTEPKSLSIQKKVTFPAGYYNQTYLEQSELPAEIKKVMDFLSSEQKIKRTTYVVDLVIKSGESQIPNTDKENGDVKVDPGFLASQRSNTIVNYVKSLLTPYVGNVLPKEIQPVIEPPKIGETKWVGQVFCPANKLQVEDKQGYACTGQNFKPAPNIQNWFNGKTKDYAKLLETYKTEQFVEVYISVKSDKPQITTLTPSQPKVEPCLYNMQIWLNYEGQGHTCNSSLFELSLRGNMGGEIKLIRNSKSKDGNANGGGVTYASLNNDGYESKSDFKSGKNKDLKLYDNEDVDNPKYQSGGKRYNMFIVPNDIKKTLNNSTEYTLMATCVNPTNHNAKDPQKWGTNCHTDVGTIRIVPSNGDKGKESIYQVKTPNKAGTPGELLRFDECGRLLKGGNDVKTVKTPSKVVAK